ncbi:uncharacterized protein LOC121838101 [Ixodes scapularis]|uniref:uncharacterized protein LOC121838101 n=1 Tax=Ixodes scapularis TaxID=6945 RepID=UPI001C386B42|nr:uncharacterized protein LOC121838101 [Ixodes scapularis]
MEDCTKKSSAGETDKATSGASRKTIRCFLCNKVGHKAENCKNRPPTFKKLTCWNCGRPGHRAENCGTRQNDRPQASCVLAEQSDGSAAEFDEAYVTLQNGAKIPVINAAVGRAPKFLVENMPVVEGRLGDRKITVLRDTGCNTVVVRKEMVQPEEFTGQSSPVYLLDRTVRYVPEAEIRVRTPYFTGRVRAKCISNPLYDLVLGNVPMVRGVNDPDPKWNEMEEASPAGKLDRQTAIKQNQETSQEKSAEQAPKGSSESLPENTPSSGQREDEPMLIANATETGKNKDQSKEPRAELRVPQVSPLEATAEEMLKEQENDKSLEKCFHNIGKTFPKHGGRTKRKFFIRNKLLYRSVIYSSGRKTDQLVLPEKFRQTVVALAHDSIMSGHQGINNTIGLVAEEFFWPGMQSEIRRYVRSCDVCQRTVPKGRVGKAPLGTMPTIATPFQRIAIDIIGPITPKSDSGKRYILTMVDVATRYPDAVALQSTGTPEVAEALMDMFARYGVPEEILSDRGSNFTSDLMKEVGRLLSMRHLLTTPYHPMCNGLVERFNGTLKQMLRRMCQERPKDWDRYLPALLFAYREVPQSSLKFSPFELLYGRRVRGPLAILREVWSNEAMKKETKTSYGYVLELREKLEETCELAHRCLEVAKEKYKGNYDHKRVKREMKAGDRALILLPSDNNKMLMQWKGPFEVMARKNEVDYELEIGGRSKIFHVNILKKYEEREESEQVGLRCRVAVKVDEDSDIITEAGEDEVPMLSLTKQQDKRDVVVHTDLNREKRQQVFDLISEYEEIFSDLPGRTNLMTCDLQLTTQTPVHIKQYPLPLKVHKLVEEEITAMLKMGVIERSTSPYNAPMVMTDHQPLEFINKAKHNNSRIMRWSLKLQDYSFHIEYIKGKDNVGADYLSRI